MNKPTPVPIDVKNLKGGYNNVAVIHGCNMQIQQEVVKL